jgi:hypothetical protein
MNVVIHKLRQYLGTEEHEAILEAQGHLAEIYENKGDVDNVRQLLNISTR